MIKVILFDCDGPIIRREKYFSQRLLEEKGIVSDSGKEQSFFKGEFMLCETGKADLKEILPKWLEIWKWQGTVDELLEYWFAGEADANKQMLEYIQTLRQKGIKCYLATNNEKYRVNYLLDAVGLRKNFDACFASCDLGHLKDQKEFWEAVLRSLAGIKPTEILLWDDDEKNIESARARGLLAEFYSDFEIFKNKMVDYGFN